MKATFKFRVERQRQMRQVVVEKAEEVTTLELELAPSPIAMRLALAYYVERCLDAGIIGSYAEAARNLGITRARMTQILDIALMPVADQESILAPI